MEASPHIVRFLLDGAVVSLEAPPPTLTVLEYLREVAGRRGTKEGCAEGDCGACTVVLGELAPGHGTPSYRAVNSCIRFVPTLDGKELVTVESLTQPSGAAHPVQQSMIDHHASQCGFCTPGFVMSLFALYLNQEAADRAQVVDALAGNLCRCTGYRPIIDAGLRQWNYPAPARWSRAAAAAPERTARLATLAHGRGASAEASLHYPGYRAPRSLEELSEAYATAPDAVLLAGGTDVGLWVTKQLRELPTLIYLGDVPQLADIAERGEHLWIGAAVTLTDAWPALLQEYPELAEQAARFASPPIRNSATLCGNLANGSPIGDSLPAMLALGAELELRCGAVTRRVPLEDFYLGYQKKALARGEFVVGVAVPRRAADAAPLLLGSYKVSKRIDQDISAVCATFYVRLAGERVTAVRLAFGGMAGIACRARRAEAALQSAGWTVAGIEAAVAALGADFQPLSDLRATSSYRLEAAGGLLRRFYLQSHAAAVAIRTADALPAVQPLGAGSAAAARE